MTETEKIKRLLRDDWEIHGEPRDLLLLLREMHLNLRRSAEYVANHTKDDWAKNYLKARLHPVSCAIYGCGRPSTLTGYCDDCFGG